MTDNAISLNYDIFEGMTSISAVIKSVYDGKSDRIIIKVLYDMARAKQKSRELAFLKHSSQKLGFELVESSSSEIDELTSGTTHGGIVAVCSKKTFPLLNVNFLTNKKFFVLLVYF